MSKVQISGMTKWLHAHHFSYKQPKDVPAKADLAKQEAFIETYLALLDTVGPDEPIVFMDSAHPTMATKIALCYNLFKLFSALLKINCQ